MDLAPSRPAESSSTASAVLPGGSQLSSVESGRRAFFRSLAHIGRQLAGALAYAHARQIVHRDIKPSNVLMDEEGVAWITDFGLAKSEDHGLTESGDILGTIRYMAPERFRGEGDARADVYALGVTLYELITLRSAFESTDRLALIERIKSEDPKRPRSIDPRIPRDLETIVLKAMEKDPAARYQTAEAMSEDLRRFLADEPIQARQTSIVERYWRWATRNPGIAVLGAALTAVLLAGTMGSILAAGYFARLAGREKSAKLQTRIERDRSQRLSAGLALDKGLDLARLGHADQGLVWMLEALKTAPDDSDEFRRVVHNNLGAWESQLHRPLKMFDLGIEQLESRTMISPDETFFVTGVRTPLDARLQPVSFWDLETGRKIRDVPELYLS